MILKGNIFEEYFTSEGCGGPERDEPVIDLGRVWS